MQDTFSIFFKGHAAMRSQFVFTTRRCSRKDVAHKLRATDNRIATATTTTATTAPRKSSPNFRRRTSTKICPRFYHQKTFSNISKARIIPRNSAVLHHPTNQMENVGYPSRKCHESVATCTLLYKGCIGHIWKILENI